MRPPLDGGRAPVAGPPEASRRCRWQKGSAEVHTGGCPKGPLPRPTQLGCRSKATLPPGVLSKRTCRPLGTIAEPVYPWREKGVLLATRVKTVNTGPTRQTVGGGSHRHGLRGTRGMQAHTFLPNPDSETAFDETRYATRRWGYLIVPLLQGLAQHGLAWCTVGSGGPLGFDGMDPGEELCAYGRSTPWLSPLGVAHTSPFWQLGTNGLCSSERFTWEAYGCK